MAAPSQHFAALDQLYHMHATLNEFAPEVRDPQAIAQRTLALQALTNATNRLARCVAIQILADEP